MSLVPQGTFGQYCALVCLWDLRRKGWCCLPLPQESNFNYTSTYKYIHIYTLFWKPLEKISSLFSQQAVEVILEHSSPSSHTIALYLSLFICWAISCLLLPNSSHSVSAPFVHILSLPLPLIGWLLTMHIHRIQMRQSENNRSSHEIHNVWYFGVRKEEAKCMPRSHCCNYYCHHYPYLLLHFSFYSQSCGTDERGEKWDGRMENLKAILVRVGALPRSKATSSSKEQWFK